MEFPSISVTAELRGAAPEVMEEGVTEILEEYVDTVPGLRSMKSTTFHGISVLRAEFELDIDIDAAARKVRDKVAQARKKLPDDLDPPIIAKVDPGGILIIWLPINSDRSVVDLTEYLTYSVKPFIETLPGVAGADIFGGRERAIRIWLDGKQLRARGLSANNVIVALRNEHVDIPGGRVASTAIEYSLKTVAGFETVEELSNLVIARVDGAKVYRRDVARVEDGAEALKSVSHYNGGWGGGGLGIVKQSRAKTVAISDGTQDRFFGLATRSSSGRQMRLTPSRFRCFETVETGTPSSRAISQAARRRQRVRAML